MVRPLDTYHDMISVEHVRTRTVDELIRVGELLWIKRRLAPRDGVDIRRGFRQHVLSITETDYYCRGRFADRTFENDCPAGSFNFFPKGYSQSTEWSSKGSVRRMSQIGLPDEVVASLLDEAGVDTDRLSFRTFQAYRSAALTKLVEAIDREAHGRGFGSRLYADTLTRTLCCEFVNRFTTDQPAGLREFFKSRKPLSFKKVEGACECLHDRWNEDLGLNELAASVGLSPFHFARHFRYATGLPPHQYQLRLRIEKARELLSDPATADVPLVSVALHCGYYDQPHFIRHFRRVVGETPSEFRQRAQA